MDRTLLEIFATEQTEHVQRMRALLDLSVLSSPEARGSTVQEFLRRAHTLKGAARAVGLEDTERFVHRMESVFARWRTGTTSPDASSLAVLQRVLEALEDILGWALGIRSQPDISATSRALDALLGVSVVPGAEVSARSVSEPTVGSAPDLVRVNALLLDDVVSAASHLLQETNRAMAASNLADVHLALTVQTVDEYSRLRRNCARYARANAQTPDFAPIKQTLEYLDRQFTHVLGSARTGAAAQQQSSRELALRATEVHQNACRARLTPAQTVFGAFGAMIRDLAGQEAKQVNFLADGLDVQADRVVLQALKDPIMHILRNALSHGIESASERIKAAKPPVGSVRLQIASRGDRLRIVVEDDGCGLDLSALARRAVLHGILTESAAQSADPGTLANLIFHPDITTAKTVTKISGRGIGLSVVAQTVNALHGDVSVRHRTGAGTSVILSLPLTISTQHVLLVQVNERTFAVPAAVIDRLCRFQAKDVRVVDSAEFLFLDGDAVPLAKLAELLSLPGSNSRNDSTFHLAAVLRSGGQRAAVIVDHLLDEREVLVKDSGLVAQRAGLSAGAVPLEDGSIAVMLNVIRLFQQLPYSRRLNFLPVTVEKRTRILVVDDSVTTRSLEKGILESHGFEVALAVDGLEALYSVRADPPDLVISDVDMPRMDGFQLLEQIKLDKAISHIPVILVTSLERREEQEKGLSLGADAYIVKRKFDQRELLQIVRQIV